MPTHSPLGIVIAFFSVVMGFGLIWHIWWMAILGLVGILGAALAHGWRTSLEVEIPVAILAAAGGAGAAE